MDLRKRLAQLDRLTRRQAPVDAPVRKIDEETLARRLEDLGLEPVRDEGGVVWRRDRIDPVPMPDALPDFAGLFTRADEADPHAEDLLFLDAETTGLAGGTGTLVFVLGLSRWRDGVLRTRQLFLSGPGREAALLRALAQWARAARVVVTFNGASFDLPLLRTRCLLQRLEDPLRDLVGWDLLVPARRLWGGLLEDCRQQTLEREVCRLPGRTGDIDGSRIPAVWFDFLAAGDTDALDRVLHHNHLDMVGMAHLFLRVAGCAERLVPPDREDLEVEDWRVSWARARICERRRDGAAAEEWMRRAVRAVPRLPDDPRFLADALRIVKRGGDWLYVGRLIREALSPGGEFPWLEREAAILYEHRLTDLEKALAHALRSGENDRVERLRRKLDRFGEE